MTAQIVIPALPAHAQVLRSTIPRIRALYGCAPLVVTPDPRALTSTLCGDCDLAADSDFCTLSKANVSDRLPPAKKWLTGWYYQQLLKYEIVLRSTVARVLILDADTVLLKRVAPPIPGSTIFPGASENHEAYFRTLETLTGVTRQLARSTVVNLMWFERSLLEALVDHISEFCHIGWRDAVIATSAVDPADCCFSEYETYANWCAYRGAPIHQPPFRLFRRGDLLVGESRTVRVIADDAEHKGYDAIAFEGALHSRSLARRVVARCLFAAGLCTNARRYA